MNPFPAKIGAVGVVCQGKEGGEGFFVTDDSGFLEIDLMRNTTYRVSFQRHQPVYNIVIPDADTADLLGLLNPTLTALEITYITV
jgi:hypothetical protein